MRLQVIRWTSAALCVLLVVASWIWDIRGGWGVLWFFALLIIGAPAALISLHFMESKSKARRAK
jgi:hypothetical protein